jgi:hypothetical protein
VRVHRLGLGCSRLRVCGMELGKWHYGALVAQPYLIACAAGWGLGVGVHAVIIEEVGEQYT